MTFVLILLISALLFSGVCAWWRERRAWNNGRCRFCGTSWRYFDMDSQGGRGYVCDTCHSTVWCSWPFTDRRRRA